MLGKDRPIDFILSMIFPVAVGYSLESVATLYSLRESPYVHFKHILNYFLDENHYIHLIF